MVCGVVGDQVGEEESRETERGVDEGDSQGRGPQAPGWGDGGRGSDRNEGER